MRPLLPSDDARDDAPQLAAVPPAAPRLLFHQDADAPLCYVAFFLPCGGGAAEKAPPPSVVVASPRGIPQGMTDAAAARLCPFLLAAEQVRGRMTG